MGVMLLGEAKREVPAQAELRPTCAGAGLNRPASSGQTAISAELTLLEEVADYRPKGNAAEHWLIKC